MKQRHISAGIALAFAVICLLDTRSLAAGIEIHVAPSGDDAKPGTVEAPVKTLDAARNLARKQAGKTPVTILCEDGVYYFDHAFELTGEDSGSKEAPVVYKAMHEGKAVLSGGIPLKLTWKAYKDGIFMAITPAGLEIDQLFINGERQNMARYPNYDPTKTTVPYRGSAADAFSPERAAKWADPTGGFIHAMHAHSWGGYHYRITGKNDKNEVTYEGGWQNNRPSGMHKTARMVENIFEELDAPNEWFHNRKTNTLYFYPPAGVDLAKANVVGVRLASLIQVHADQSKPLRFVTFDGFVLRHTARTFMENKEPLLRSDWTIFRGGAMLLEGTEDCQVTNCFIDQPGANAVFVNRYNRRLHIAGLHVFGAGASAVAFVGDPAAVRNPVFQYGGKHDIASLDLTPGPLTENYPMDCVVEDSLLHEIGMVEKQGAGIEISMSRRITVRDCSIYDTSRAGINIGDGCWGGHIIEGCDVFKTVQETGDHGSFNSWGRDRYWLPGRNAAQGVAANPNLPFLDAMEPTIIRNSRWRCDRGWDIDLDDGSTNYEIYNNLMLHGGLKLREGYKRIATNNIIVNSTLHPHVWFPESGDVFAHNIIMGGYKPAMMSQSEKWGKTIDSNLFTTSNKDRVKFATNDCDANSVVGDPKFADPTHGNFTVGNESLAKTTGFKNFPMNHFGVQKPSLKAIAKTPEIPTVTIQPDLTPAAPTATPSTAVTWLGATLSEPKGETLSAYGVALDSGGVAIDKLQSGSPLGAAKGLQEGDLIRSLNRQPIKSIADLKRVVGGIHNDQMNLEVVRNQSKVGVQLKIPGLKF